MQTSPRSIWQRRALLTVIALAAVWHARYYDFFCDDAFIALRYAKNLIEEHALESRTKAVLISPAWGQVDLQQLADWIASSGLNVRMQLQLHKYIWGPDVKGV